MFWVIIYYKFREAGSFWASTKQQHILLRPFIHSFKTLFIHSFIHLFVDSFV